jgi:hypothetical protein
MWAPVAHRLLIIQVVLEHQTQVAQCQVNKAVLVVLDQSPVQVVVVVVMMM